MRREITRGVLGTDVGIETADVALMRDDLLEIPYAVDLNTKILVVIEENIDRVGNRREPSPSWHSPGRVILALEVGVGDTSSPRA